MYRDLASEKRIFGGALREPPKRSQMPGIIVRVNPLQGSCDVSAGGNYYGNIPLPDLARDVEGSGGEFKIVRRGTPVVLRLDMGWPIIAQVLPISTDQEAVGRPSFKLDPTGSASGDLFSSDDGPTFLGRLPKDMHMGDRGWVGNQGQKLAILDGGVVSMEASPMALVEVNQDEDTLLMAGRNTRLMTGFGNIEFNDRGGKSSFVFEGGTDQITQTGAGKKNWTISAEMGGEAEGLVDFQTRNLGGQRVSSLTMNIDGSEQRYNAGNTSVAVDGAHQCTVKQGRSVFITQGSDYLEVRGAREEQIYGNYITEAFDTRFCRVGGDRRDEVMRDWNLAAMRNMKVNVSGDALQANPTTNALDFTVTNGSVLFDIGNAAAGDFPKAMSGFKVNTHGPGNVELLATELGMLMIDAALPAASVYIGANISTTPTAPKGGIFEPAVLGWKFIELITRIVTAHDTHVHILPPPLASLAFFAPTLPPVIPMSPMVLPNLPFSVSKKVMVGS